MSKSLLKSTSVVASMTMLSRVMGFIRDMVIAYAFGASAGTDAYLVAFKIPNLFRRFFAEGAFSQAFVPVLADYRHNHSEDEVQGFINRIAGTLGMALLVMTILSMLLAPLFVYVFAPGFAKDGLRFGLATEMLRITFPYLLFISMTAFFGAILNTYGRFAVPAFTPVFLNLVMILAVLFLAPHMKIGIHALAWGIFFAGVVQLLFQVPFLRRIKRLPKFQLGFKDPGVKRVLKLMVPALFGVSVAQINIMLDTIFASFLTVGSVSWLFYSDRLTEFPLGVFGVAIATVILPNLSHKHIAESSESFSHTLDWALRSILLLGVPAAIGLFTLANPLLTTLFQHGNFTAHDVAMASLSLRAFAIGLPAFMLVKVLATGFYSKQNIRTPVRIGLYAMFTNMVLNAVFIVPFAHMGIALATSLSGFMNAGLLFLTLYKQGIYKPSPGWGLFGLRMMFASTLMYASLKIAMHYVHSWGAVNWHVNSLNLTYLVMLGMMSYTACLWMSGLRVRDIRA